MLVFGFGGIPVVLFPPDRSRYFEYKDQGLINSVKGLVNRGVIKIYCPDSIDESSWYNYGVPASERVKNHLIYEQAILNDVINFAKFETDMEKVLVAGCALGGYHALNFTLKYPESISGVCTLNGDVDIKKFILGHYDEDCYFNNPVDYLPNLEDEKYLSELRKISIILGAINNHSEIDKTRMIHESLKQKGINSKLDIRKTGLNYWQNWRDMFPQYLNKILREN